MSSLGEAFPLAQGTVRRMLTDMAKLPDGAAAVDIANDLLDRADTVMASGDVIEMLQLWPELKAAAELAPIIAARAADLAVP